MRALTLVLALATAAAAQEPGEPLALRLTYSLGPTAGFAPYPRATTPLIVAVSVNADPKGERDHRDGRKCRVPPEPTRAKT